MAEQLKRQFQFESPDKMLKVDHALSLLAFFPNEQAHFTTKNVIDLAITKNITNVEMQGTIVLTNLRLIYMLDSQKTINTTIGYECIRTINVGTMQGEATSSSASAKTTALNTLILMCEHGNDSYRFEYLPRGSRSVFEVLQRLFRAYDTARVYRQLRVRQIIDINRIFMDDETCATTFKNVVVLSSLSPIAVEGTMALTSFRIFWHATGQPHLNISLPYIAVEGIQVKPQRFGKNEAEEPAVLIQAESGNKSLVMACKVPGMVADALYAQVLDIIERAERDPNYGVKVEANKPDDTIEMGFESQFVQEQDTISKITQIIGSVDRIEGYFQSREQGNDIVYSDEYGVAFEGTNGVSLEQLWNL